MLGLGISIPQAALRTQAVFADHALALDFKNNRFRQDGLLSGNVGALSGYSYGRSGQKWELKP